MSNKIHVADSGMQICLVDREQLRVHTHAYKLSIPRHLRAVLATIPSSPSVYEWSLNEKIIYDILGNDFNGDCWYAAVCHGAQTWLGNAVENFLRFNPTQVVARYRQLSGGDNGLSDATMMSEWTTGIVGPNGPHKIFSRATLDPKDIPTCTAAFYFFGGGSYTGALPDAWITNPHPGMVWTATGPANPNNGHAVHISGKNARGNYVMRTWAITPPIEMDQAGLESSDPELMVQASLDWFNAAGYAPNGLHYIQLAPIWSAMGGPPWPPSPFPAPGPNPIPNPPNPIPNPIPNPPFVYVTKNDAIAWGKQGIELGRPYPGMNDAAHCESWMTYGIVKNWPKGQP